MRPARLQAAGSDVVSGITEQRGDGVRPLGVGLKQKSTKTWNLQNKKNVGSGFRSSFATSYFGLSEPLSLCL